MLSVPPVQDSPKPRALAGPCPLGRTRKLGSQGGAQVGRRPVSQETVLPLRKGCAGPGTAGRMHQGLGWGRVSWLGVRMRRSGRQCRGQRQRDPGRTAKVDGRRRTGPVEKPRSRRSFSQRKEPPSGTGAATGGSPTQVSHSPSLHWGSRQVSCPVSTPAQQPLPSLTQATIRCSPHPCLFCLFHPGCLLPPPP